MQNAIKLENISNLITSFRFQVISSISWRRGALQFPLDKSTMILKRRKIVQYITKVHFLTL